MPQTLLKDRSSPRYHLGAFWYEVLSQRKKLSDRNSFVFDTSYFKLFTIFSNLYDPENIEKRFEFKIRWFSGHFAEFHDSTAPHPLSRRKNGTSLPFLLYKNARNIQATFPQARTILDSTDYNFWSVNSVGIGSLSVSYNY